MKATLRQAQAQVNRLKNNTGMGSLVTVDLVLDFSGFDNCTEKDNYHIPLRCTRNEALLLKRRQEYSNINVPLSD